MIDPSEVSVPRLARLVKGNQGYGFNLHGDKNQPGQTISAVDKDSPAEQGGLKEGDRLIQVNGDNVEGMSHGDVVKKIKENPNETTLLVCDKVTLAYLKENNRSCTADMVNLSTVYVNPEPEPAPVIANGDATPDVVSEKIEQSAPVAVEESAPPPAPVSKEETEPAPEPSGPTPDEAEAVKGLDRVVNEQEERPAEVPVVESEPPKPVEPKPEEPKPEEPKPEVPAAAPQVEEPAKSSDGDLVLDMKAARPSVNKKKLAKQSGQDWSNKVSVLNSL